MSEKLHELRLGRAGIAFIASCRAKEAIAPVIAEHISSARSDRGFGRQVRSQADALARVMAIEENLDINI
jgi:hypothetical protein